MAPQLKAGSMVRDAISEGMGVHKKIYFCWYLCSTCFSKQIIQTKLDGDFISVCSQCKQKNSGTGKLLWKRKPFFLEYITIVREKRVNTTGSLANMKNFHYNVRNANHIIGMSWWARLKSRSQSITRSCGKVWGWKGETLRFSYLRQHKVWDPRHDPASFSARGGYPRPALCSLPTPARSKYADSYS